MELKNIIETLNDMKILLTKLTAHITPESLENLYGKYKGLVYEFSNRTKRMIPSEVKSQEPKIEKFMTERNYTDAKILFGTIIAGVLVEMQHIAGTV